jgi:putative ABC transport system permease protein
MRKASDSTVLWQGNPVQFGKNTNSEALTDTKPKTYKVVGICKRPGFESYSAPGYTVITLAEQARTL